MLLRRKILKLFGLSILFVSLPYQFLKSATKKIINPDLTKAQKDIMFNEGTERPFTSELLKEKREVFFKQKSKDFQGYDLNLKVYEI